MEKNLVLEALKRIEKLNKTAEENYEKSRAAQKEMKKYYNKARATDREIQAELSAICKENYFKASDLFAAVGEAKKERGGENFVEGCISCNINLSKLPDNQLFRLAPVLMDKFCQVNPEDIELKPAREVLISRVKEVAISSGLTLCLSFGDHAPVYSGDYYILDLPIKVNDSYFDLDKFLEKATFVVWKDATGHHLTSIYAKCHEMLIRVPSTYIVGKNRLSNLIMPEVLNTALLNLIENEKFFPIEETKTK